MDWDHIRMRVILRIGWLKKSLKESKVTTYIGQTKAKAGGICDTQVNEEYMNELRLYQNDNDLETRMTKKDLKNWKLLLRPIKCTFLFGVSIIKAPG